MKKVVINISPIDKAIRMLKALNDGERVKLKSGHELAMNLEDRVVFVAENITTGREVALNCDMSINAFIQECITAKIKED